MGSSWSEIEYDDSISSSNDGSISSSNDSNDSSSSSKDDSNSSSKDNRLNIRLIMNEVVNKKEGVCMMMGVGVGVDNIEKTYLS
jgi:hypothetical protein